MVVLASPQVQLAESNNIALSVIIPCFNHGKFLVEAIASVELYQGHNCELIVINDGSTEPETLQILHELKSKYCIYDQPNQGLAAARNYGIELARGRYILPLDSDNKIRPTYISKGIEVLDQYPAVGVVYSDVEFFGEQIGRWELPDFDLARLMLANYIDACAVFRKSVWQECGGYDSEIPDKLGYEDWDFWLSVAERGWKFYHIPEVMYDYRVRNNSMVQACKIPENQKRLVHYICSKHEKLYRSNYADIIAEKELALFRQQNETANLQQQVQNLQSKLERSQQHNAKVQSDLQAEIDRLHTQAQQLKDEIAWMHTSKFWQLRSAWLNFKHMITGDHKE